MKAKLTCTMYYDYESGCWDWDNPDGKLVYEHSLFRKGAVFDVYSTPEEIKQISEDFGLSGSYGVICANKRGDWIGYENWHDFEKRGIWEIINHD